MSVVSMTMPQSRRACFSLYGIEQTRFKPSWTYPADYKSKAFQLLELLLIRNTHVVSYDEILEYLYPDPDTQPLTWKNCLTVATVQLRKAGVPITTHWGRGLSLNNEDDF